MRRVTGAPTIRTATAADGIAASAIFDASRAHNLAFLPVLHTRAEDDAFFTAAVARDAWVAVDADDRPLAFAVFHDGMLAHLYVHPDAQGQGLGSALLEAAKAAHPKGFSLFVFQRNERARRFYERRGFRAVRFDRDNEEDEPDILERWPGADPA